MMSSKNHNSRIFLRALALLTLVAFVCTDTLFFHSKSLAATPSTTPLEGQNTRDLSASAQVWKTRVPSEWGTVSEIYQAPRDREPGTRTDPNGSRFVVFIQDAHDSLEAQENIAKIIGRLVAESGVRTVLEEGYEGPVPTDQYFGFMKDPEIKRKVSYFLMDRLRIRAAEYAHINRTREFKLIGADSLKLHKENVDEYRRSAEKKSSISSDLAALDEELQGLVVKRFPKEFYQWLKVKEQFDAKKLDLFTYVGRTLPLADRVQGIGYRKNSKQKVNPENVAQPLLEFIFEIAKSNDPGVIEKAKKIDAREIFGELIKLEEAVAETYLKEPTDQKLFEYYKILKLLKRLNELEVTQEEYEAAKVHLAAFNTRSFGEFIHQNISKPLVLSKQWEKNIRDAVHFYEIAKARDQAVDDQLERFLQSPDETAAVLVFGGFHKENIQRILEAKGISYVVVSPRMTRESPRHQEYYKRLMSGGLHSFEVPLALRTATVTLGTFEVPFGRAEVEALGKAAERNPTVNPQLLDRYVTVTASQPSVQVAGPLKIEQVPVARSEMRKSTKGKSATVPSKKERLPADSIAKWIFVLLPWIACGGLVSVFGVIPWMWPAFAFAVPFGVIWSLFAYRAHPKTFEERMIASGLQALVGTTLTLLVAVHYAAPISWYFYLKPLKENHQVAGLGIMEQASRWVYLNRNTKHFTLPGIIGQQFPGANVIVVPPDQPYGTTLHEVLHEYMDRLSPEQLKTFQDLTRLGQQRNIEFMLLRPEWERRISIPNETTRQDLVRVASEETIIEFVAKAAVMTDDLNRNILSDGLPREEAERKLMEYIQGFRGWNAHIGNVNLDHLQFIAEPSPALKVWAMETFFPMVRVPFSTELNLWGWYQAQLKTSIASPTPNTNSPATRSEARNAKVGASVVKALNVLGVPLAFTAAVVHFRDDYLALVSGSYWAGMMTKVILGAMTGLMGEYVSQSYMGKRNWEKIGWWSLARAVLTGGITFGLLYPFLRALTPHIWLRLILDLGPYTAVFMYFTTQIGIWIENHSGPNKANGLTLRERLEYLGFFYPIHLSYWAAVLGYAWWSHPDLVPVFSAVTSGYSTIVQISMLKWWLGLSTEKRDRYLGWYVRPVEKLGRRIVSRNGKGEAGNIRSRSEMRAAVGTAVDLRGAGASGEENRELSDRTGAGEREYALGQTVQGREAWIERQLRGQDSRVSGAFFTALSGFSTDAFDNVLDAMFRHFGLPSSKGPLKELIRPLRRDPVLLARLLARSGRWNVNQPFGRLITEAIHELEPGLAPSREADVSFSEPAEIQSKSLADVLAAVKPWGRLSIPVRLTGQPVYLMGDHDFAYPVIRLAQNRNELPRKHLILINWDEAFHYDGARPEEIQAFEKKINEDPGRRELFYRLSSSRKDQDAWEIRKEWLYPGSFIEALILDGSVDDVVHVVASDWPDNKNGNLKLGVRQLTVGGREVRIIRARPGELISTLRQLDPEQKRSAVQSIDYDHFVTSSGGRSRVEPNRVADYRAAQEKLHAVQPPALVLAAFSTPSFTPAELVPEISEKLGLGGGDRSLASDGFLESAGYRPEVAGFDAAFQQRSEARSRSKQKESEQGKFVGGVFYPAFEGSEQDRADRVFEAIENLNKSLLKIGVKVPEKFLEKDFGEPMTVYLKNLPARNSAQRKILSDTKIWLQIWTEESYSVIWKHPESGRYYQIAFEPGNSDRTGTPAGYLQQLFLILKGDEFDGVWLASSSERSKESIDWSTFDDRALYQRTIHPLIASAVLSLLEDRLSLKGDRPIQLVDIFGGDGSLIQRIHEAIRKRFGREAAARMQYVLIENNPARLEAARKKLASLMRTSNARIVSKDLVGSTGELQRTFKDPVDMITSSGGGFHAQASDPATAQRLAGETYQALTPGGHLILTGISRPFLKPMDFEKFDVFNTSIPGRFLTQDHPDHLYVLRKSSSKEQPSRRSEMRGKPAALNPLYGETQDEASAGNWQDPVSAERNRILKEAGVRFSQFRELKAGLYPYQYPNPLLEALIEAMFESGIYAGDPKVLLRVAQGFFKKAGGDKGVRDLIERTAGAAAHQDPGQDPRSIHQLLKDAAGVLMEDLFSEILRSQTGTVKAIDEGASDIPTESLYLKYWHVFRITPAELDQLMRRPQGFQFPRTKAEEIALDYEKAFGIQPVALGRAIVENPDVLYVHPAAITGTLGITKEEAVSQLPLAVTLVKDKAHSHFRPTFKKKMVLFRELEIPADKRVSVLSSLSGANFPVLKFIVDHVRGKILLEDPSNLTKLYNGVLSVLSQMPPREIVDDHGVLPGEIQKMLGKAITETLDQRMPDDAFAKASKEDLRAHVFALIEKEARDLKVELDESGKREIYRRVGDRYRGLATATAAAADPSRILPPSLDDFYKGLSRRPKAEALETLARVLEEPVFYSIDDVTSPEPLQKKIKGEPRLSGVVADAGEMARIFGVSPGILAEEEHFGWAVGMLAAMSTSQREQLAHKAQVLKRFVKDEGAMLLGLNSIREASLSVLEILAETFPEHLRNSNDRELVRLYQLLATELENPTLATLLADAKKIRKKEMDYKAKLKPFLQRYLDALKASGFKTAVPAKPDIAPEVIPYEVPKAIDNRLTGLMSFWQGRRSNEDSILKSFFDVNADLLDLVLDILEGERAAKHVFTSATQILALNAAINKKVEKSEGVKVSAYIDAHAAMWQKDLRRKVREAIQETLDIRSTAKAGEELPRPQEHLRERGQQMLAAGMSPERIGLAFSSVYDINPDFFDLVIKMALEKNRVFEAGNKIKNVDDQFKAYLRESGVSFPSLMKQPFKEWDRAVRQSLTLTIKSNSISRSESREEVDRQGPSAEDLGEAALRWPQQRLEASIKALKDDIENFKPGSLTAKEISLQSLLDDFNVVREQWVQFKMRLLSLSSGRREEIGGPISEDLDTVRWGLISLIESRGTRTAFAVGLVLTVLIVLLLEKSLSRGQMVALFFSGTAILFAICRILQNYTDRSLIRYLQNVDFSLRDDESGKNRSEMRDAETVQTVEKLSLEKLMERHSQAIEWMLRVFESQQGMLPPDAEDKDYLKIKVILDSRSTQEMLDAADKRKASALETLQTIATEAATAEPDREAYYQGWKKRVDEALAQYAEDEQEGTGRVWQVRELREAVRRFISDPANAATYSEYIGKRDWVIGKLKEAAFMRSLEEGDRKLGANFSSTAFLTKFFFTLLQKQCPPGELQTNLEKGGVYADELWRSLKASWPRLEMSPAISSALRAYYLKAYVMKQTFWEGIDGQKREVSLTGGHEVSLATIVNAYRILRSLGMNDQEIYEFLEKALIDGRDSLTNFDRGSRKTVAQVIQEAVAGHAWMAELREWDQKIGWLVRDDFFSEMLALKDPEQQWAPGDFQAAATSAIRQPRGNYAGYFKQKLQEHRIGDPLNAGILSALRAYYLQTYLDHKKITTEEPVQPGTPATAAPARSLLGDQKIERSSLVHAYSILRSRGRSDQEIYEFLEKELLAQRANVVASDPGLRKSVSAVIGEALKARSEMRAASEHSKRAQEDQLRRFAAQDLREVFLSVKSAYRDLPESHVDERKHVVTVADHLVQLLLALKLQELFPGEYFLGEEKIDLDYLQEQFARMAGIGKPQLQRTYGNDLARFKQLLADHAGRTLEKPAARWNIEDALDGKSHLNPLRFAINDPVDGTVNYSKGNVMYGFSLGRTVWNPATNLHEPDYSLTYAPEYAVTFDGREKLFGPMLEFSKNENRVTLYRSLPGGTIEPVVQNLILNPPSARKENILVLRDSQGEGPNWLIGPFRALYPDYVSEEKWDSSVVGIMETLLGNLTLYGGIMQIWDHAGSLGIVRAMGGKVFRIDSQGYGRELLGYTDNDLRRGSRDEKFPVVVVFGDKAIQRFEDVLRQVRFFTYAGGTDPDTKKTRYPSNMAIVTVPDPDAGLAREITVWDGKTKERIARVTFDGVFSSADKITSLTASENGRWVFLIGQKGLAALDLKNLKPGNFILITSDHKGNPDTAIHQWLAGQKDTFTNAGMAGYWIKSRGARSDPSSRSRSEARIRPALQAKTRNDQAVIPLNIDPAKKIARVIILSDFDGVWRFNNGHPLDAKVAGGFQSLMASGLVHLAVISGSPAAPLVKAPEPWQQDGKPTGELIANLFPDQQNQIRIYGFTGAQVYDFRTRQAAFIKTVYDDRQTFEISKILLEAFLRIVVIGQDKVTAHVEKARQLLSKIDQIQFDPTATTVGTRLSVWDPIARVIKEEINPSLWFIDRGTEVEIGNRDAAFNLRLMEPWVQQQISANPALKDLPAEDRVFLSEGHCSKITKSTKRSAAKAYREEMMRLAEEGLDKEHEQVLVIALGDASTDFPMYESADLAFHMGPAAHQQEAGFEHMIVSRRPDGSDVTKTGGTAEVIANLSRALGKPFREFKYFQTRDPSGSWTWKSLQDLNLAARSEMRTQAVEGIHAAEGPLLALLQQATGSSGDIQIQFVEQKGNRHLIARSSRGTFRFWYQESSPLTGKEMKIFTDEALNQWSLDGEGRISQLYDNQRKIKPAKILISGRFFDAWTHGHMPRQAQVIDEIIEANHFDGEIVEALRALKRAIRENQIIEALPAEAPDAELWKEIGTGAIGQQGFLGRRWQEADASELYLNSYFARLILEKIHYRASHQDPYAFQKEKDLNEVLAEAGLADQVRKTQEDLPALLQASLWGNQFDATNPVDRTRQFMITGRDRIDAAVKKLEDSATRRIDFETDNSAAELLGDLRLIHYLLKQNSARRVYLHIKNYPYLINDVTQADLDLTLKKMKIHADPVVQQMGQELHGFIDEGRLQVLTHPFSTTGVVFEEMPQALKEHYSKSDLWILKGDANYRRITGVRYWGIDADPREMVPDFAPPVLIIRAAKNEVMAGAQKEIVDQLASRDPEWFRKGIGGMIQLISRSEARARDQKIKADELAPAELRGILERKLPSGASGGAKLHEDMIRAFENLGRFYEHPRYSLRVTVDRAPSREDAVHDYEQQYGIRLIQPVHISLEYLDSAHRLVGESGFFLDAERPGILFSRGTRIFLTENRDQGLRGSLLDLLRDRLPEEAFLLTAIGNDMTLLEINRTLIAKPKIPEIRRMLLRHVVGKYQNLIEARTDVGEAEKVDQGDHLLLMEYILMSYTDPANHLSAAELGTTLVGGVGAHFGDQSILPLRVGPHQTTVIFHLIPKGKPGKQDIRAQKPVDPQASKPSQSKPSRSEARTGHLSRRGFLSRGAALLAGFAVAGPSAVQQVLAGTRLAMSAPGRLDFNVSGPGLYQVESRPAVGEGDWSARETLQIDTPGSYQWQDPNDVSRQPRQLYRVKQIHPLTAQLAAFRNDQIQSLGNFFQPGVGIHTTYPYPIDVQQGNFWANWTQPTLIGFRAEELAFSVAGDVPSRDTFSSAQTYLTEMHRFMDRLLMDQTNLGWRGLLPWFRMTAGGIERERQEIAFIDNANLTRSLMTASGALLRSQKTHPELAESITAARQKMKDFLDKQKPGFQAFYDPGKRLFRGSGITQGLNIVWTDGYSIDRLFSEYATAAAAVVTYFGIAPEAFTGLTPRFVQYTINGVTRWVPESWDGAGFQMTWNASYVKDAPTLRAVWKNWALAAMHECSVNGVPGIPTAGFNPDSGLYSGQIGLSFHETPDSIISTIGLLNPLDSLNELLFASDPVAWRKSILTQLPALASVYGNVDSATYTGKVSTDVYVGVDHYASFLGLTGKQGESFKAFMEDTENPGGPLYTRYVDLLEQAPVKAYAAPFDQPFAAPPVIRTGSVGEVGTAPVSTDPLYSYVYFDHVGRLGNGDGSMTSLVNNGILSLVVFHSPAGWIGEGGTKVPLPRLYANYVRLKVRAPNATGTVSFKVELPGFFSGKKTFTFVASDLKDWENIYMPLDKTATRMTYIAFSDLAGTPDIQFADLELKAAIQPAPARAASLAATGENKIYYSRAARTAQNLEAMRAVSNRSETRTKAAPQGPQNREEHVLGADLEAFLDGRAHEFYGEREAVYGERGIHVMVYWGGPVLTSVTYKNGPEGREIKFGSTSEDIGRRVIRQLKGDKKDFDPDRLYRVVTMPASEEYLGLSIVPAETRSEMRAQNLGLVDERASGDREAIIKRLGEILASEGDRYQEIIVLKAIIPMGQLRNLAGFSSAETLNSAQWHHVVARLIDMLKDIARQTDNSGLDRDRGLPDGKYMLATGMDPDKKVPAIFIASFPDAQSSSIRKRRSEMREFLPEQETVNRALAVLKALEHGIRLWDGKDPETIRTLGREVFEAATGDGAAPAVTDSLSVKFQQGLALLDGEKTNPPAAQAVFSKVASEASKEYGRISRERTQLLGDYIKAHGLFWFDVKTKEYVFLQGTYKKYKVGSQKISIRTYDERRFEALWEAFRAVDHQIESELDEILKLRGLAAKLKKHEKLFERAWGSNMLGSLARPADVTEQDWEELITVICEVIPGLRAFWILEKEAAQAGLVASGALVATRKVFATYARVSNALALVQRRIANAESIIRKLEAGRLAQMRLYLKFTDQTLNEKLNQMSRLSGRDEIVFRRVGFAVRQMLKDKKEPELHGLLGLVAGAMENRDKRSHYLNLAQRKAASARILHDWMANYRAGFKQKRLAWMESPEATEAAFMEQYRAFLKGRRIDARSTEAKLWKLRFYQAVMVPLFVDAPKDAEAVSKERIPNPVFEAFSVLIYLTEVQDIQAILGAHSVVSRSNVPLLYQFLEAAKAKKIDDLKQGGKVQALEALAQDLKIGVNELSDVSRFARSEARDPEAEAEELYAHLFKASGRSLQESAALQGEVDLEALRMPNPFSQEGKKLMSVLSQVRDQGVIEKVVEKLDSLGHPKAFFYYRAMLLNQGIRLRNPGTGSDTTLLRNFHARDSVKEFLEYLSTNHFDVLNEIIQKLGKAGHEIPEGVRQKLQYVKIVDENGKISEMNAEILKAAIQGNGLLATVIFPPAEIFSDAFFQTETPTPGRSEARKDIASVTGAEIERAADLLLAGNILSDTQKGKGRDFWVRKLQQTIGRHLAGESYNAWLGYFQAAVGTPERARELIRIFESLGFQFTGKPEFSLGGALGIPSRTQEAPSPDRPVPGSGPQGYREMRAAALGLSQRNQYAQAVEIAEQFLLIPEVPARDRDQMRMALGEWALYARQHQKAIDVIAPMAADPGVLPDKKGALYYILGAARSGLGFQNRQEPVLRQAIQDLRTADEFLVPTESTWTSTTILLFANVHNQLGTIYTNLAPTARQARGLTGFRETLDLARQEYERLLTRAGLSLDDFRGQGFGPEAFGHVFAGIMHKLEINETNSELLAKALRQKGLFVTTFIGLVRSVVDREQDEEGHMTLDRDRLILMSNLLAFAMAFRPQGVYLMYIERYLAQLTFNLYLRETGDRALLEEAERKFREVIRLGETQPEAEGVAASDDVWLGDVLMEKARVLDPSDAGQNETATGFRREAVSRFQAALQRNPEHALAQRRLANIAQRFPGLSPRSEMRNRDSAGFQGLSLPVEKETGILTAAVSQSPARSEARPEHAFYLKEQVVFSIEAEDLAELKNWPELLAIVSFNPRRLCVAVTGPGNAISEARMAEMAHFGVTVLREEQLSRFPKNAPIFHFGNMADNADAVRARIAAKLGRPLKALLGIAPGSFLLPGLLLDKQVTDAALSRRGGFLFDDGRFTGRFLEVLFRSFEIISSAA